MKTNILIHITLLLVAGMLLLAESCTIYMPQPAAIPLMNERNEVQISGGFTSLGGLNGSVAYAPGNHVALQAYGSMHTTEIRYFQGSLGYYTRSKSDLNFEIFGGLAFGNGSEWGLDNMENFYVDYLLYFAQVNFGQTNLGSAHIDYGFGLKSGIFDAIKSYNFNSVPVNYSSNTINALLIEPQAFIRMGGKKFKVGLQVNGTWISSLDRYETLILYYPVNLGISLNYRIAPSLKKK